MRATEPFSARFALFQQAEPSLRLSPHSEEKVPPMIRDIDPIEEIRLVLGAAAVVYLTQRTGPTRYQRIKTRIDPRGWVDTAELRDRFHDAVDAFRHRAEEVGEQAGDFSREARHRAADVAYDARDRADEWFRAARKGSKKAAKKHGKTVRRYADDAGSYARDHAREGGALLAVATIAAAVGAAVLESRRPDSRVRRIVRF